MSKKKWKLSYTSWFNLDACFENRFRSVTIKLAIQSLTFDSVDICNESVIFSVFFVSDLFNHMRRIGSCLVMIL